MKVFSPSVATLLAVVLFSADASKPRVNGWYPCAFSTETIPSMGTSFQNMTVFECAEVEVPLCYEGICTSDRKINVFTKRRLAKNVTDTSAPRKAAILIQGGPGAASPAMESIMVSLLAQESSDSIDLYTFDHRGTGRSEFLQCDAAQASTPGSPGAKEITLDEMQTCLEDLNFQYDDQAAAFSTTSAAMDVRTLIDTFMADQHVYVAGFSYGTYLTQRILQLNVPQVRGYVFDGVDALTTKDDPLDSSNSNWNQLIQASGRRLLQFCFDDPQCPVQLKSRETALEDTLAILDKLDSEKASSPCAQAVIQATGYDLPSVGLRDWMSNLARSYTDRTSAIKMLGYVQRCGEADVAAIIKAMGGARGADDISSATSSGDGELTQETQGSATSGSDGLEESGSQEEEGIVGREAEIPDPLNDMNALLYNVIVFSERYRQPAPLKSERDVAFFGGAFSMDGNTEALSYCVFTGSTEPACEERRSELPTGNATFFYQRDKYISQKLVLPDYASALVMNGGLDFQTPLELGELLYTKISGSGKGTMMVDFDYGTHCGGEAVAESPASPCHDSIIAQFIAKDGDVSAVDTNCMMSLPSTVFH